MPDNDDKAVVFLLPSGEEVSNDPRYGYEKMREQVLKDVENTGKATPSMSEMHSQLGTGGERSVFTGADAAMSQPPVRMQIVDSPQQAGSTEDTTGGNPDAEEEDGDDTDYTTWGAKELKAEVDKRELDRSGLTKKSQLVNLLTADDEAANKTQS